VPCDAARNNSDGTAGRYSDTTDRPDATFTHTDRNRDTLVAVVLDSSWRWQPEDTKVVAAYSARVWDSGTVAGHPEVTETAGRHSDKDVDMGQDAVTGTEQVGSWDRDTHADTS
jgi:hypothetical protein